MELSLPAKLGRQFEAFARVVYALVLREARTRHGRSRLGYLWALLEPAVQLGVLWFFYELVGRRSPVNASMAAFLLTGIFPFLAWRAASVRGATAVSSNIPLMVHPQVQPFSIVVARVLLELATNLLVFVVFVLILRAFFGEPLSSWTDEPLHLLSALGALALLAFGFAMFNASMARIMTFWPELMRMTARVLFFTSGVFYTMEALPPRAREFVLLNPLAHIIEWIRSAALPGFESLHYSVTYPLVWGVWLLFAGLFIDWLLRLSGHAEAH